MATVAEMDTLNLTRETLPPRRGHGLSALPQAAILARR